MNPIAKALVVSGGVLVVSGLLWQVVHHLGGRIPLGRLPGDIAIEKENVRFYFPLATSILLSLVVSLVLYLIRFFKH